MSQHYAGLDVLDEIHISILDAAGAVVWRGKSPMCSDAIAKRLTEHAPHLVRVGLKNGQLSAWLTLQCAVARRPWSASTRDMPAPR